MGLGGGAAVTVVTLRATHPPKRRLAIIRLPESNSMLGLAFISFGFCWFLYYLRHKKYKKFYYLCKNLALNLPQLLLNQ